MGERVGTSHICPPWTIDAPPEKLIVDQGYPCFSFRRSMCSVHSAISSSMRLSSRAKRISYGFFSYRLKSGFLLAFNSSRLFFQSTGLANNGHGLCKQYALSGRSLFPTRDKRPGRTSPDERFDLSRTVIRRPR